MDQLSVLIVEDNAELLALLQFSFQDEGYQVSVAQDGLAALELIERDGLPAVIVTDLSMPRMDGSTLAHAVRQRFPGGDRTLIVVCSARIDSGPQHPFDLVVPKCSDNAFDLPALIRQRLATRAPESRPAESRADESRADDDHR